MQITLKLQCWTLQVQNPAEARALLFINWTITWIIRHSIRVAECTHLIFTGSRVLVNLIGRIRNARRDPASIVNISNFDVIIRYKTAVKYYRSRWQWLRLYLQLYFWISSIFIILVSFRNINIFKMKRYMLEYKWI